MSDEEFEKYDDLNDLSLNGDKSKDLDEYGVWIKKRPSAYGDDDSLSDEVSSIAGDEAESAGSGDEAFDFDGLGDDVTIEKGSSLETDSSGDDSLGDVDMSDFFTDFGEQSTDENAETEDTIKMDLNFETVDSFVDDGNSGDDFDAMLNEANESGNADVSFSEDFSEEDDFSDLLSSPASSSSLPETQNHDSDMGDISLDVKVDEEQDFDMLSDDSSVVIDSPTESFEEESVKANKEDDMIIKNTVIESENMDEIKTENKQVLNNESTIEESKNDVLKESESMGGFEKHGFSDVDALAKDLAEDTSRNEVNSFQDGLRTNVVSVEGLDKVANLLSEMAKELTSIKQEIVSLKETVYSSSTSISQNDGISSSDKTEDSEESGFFKDEDTDEAIALTGDELNNILITADFTEEESVDAKSGDVGEDDTEESSKDVEPDEVSKDGEDGVGACEACGENEKNLEDENNDFDAEFEFDDIELETSKLDDFVIPEELDYNMLNIEDGDVPRSDSENEKVDNTDMSYLDEKDVPSDLPQTQEVSTSEYNSDVSSDDELPSNIKKDIKSVLAYMDQLLESLPEDKIKEFAESEYFEMYHRLFNELGIS